MEPRSTARLAQSVAAVTSFSSSARSTMYVAGMRSAEQMALRTPSQIEWMNSLRFSSPQNAKNFFSVRIIYATPSSSSFTLMWASHISR